MTLRTVLLSLQALLAAAEPDDPQDAVVAKQFKDDYDMFKLTAKHWACVYAGGRICFLGEALSTHTRQTFFSKRFPPHKPFDAVRHLVRDINNSEGRKQKIISIWICKLI